MGPKSIKFVFFNHDASCIIYNVSFSSFIPMFAEFWVNSGNSPRHLASKCLIGPPVAFKHCHCCKHRGSYLQALDGAGWDSIGMSMMSLPATVYYILLCHVNIGRSPITVNPKRKGENMWNHAFSVVCSWNWWQGQCCTFRSSVKRYIDPIWSHEVSVQGKYCHTSSHKRVDQNRFVPVIFLSTSWGLIEGNTPTSRWWFSSQMLSIALNMNPAKPEFQIWAAPRIFWIHFYSLFKGPAK